MTDLPPPPAIVHEIVLSDPHAIDHQKIAWEHLSTMNQEELDENFKLEEFFGSIYVINLPKAKERLMQVAHDMEVIGLKHFRVWRATNGRDPAEVSENIWKRMSLNWLKYDTSTENGKNWLDYQHQGETGCYLSHYRLIKYVKARFEAAYKDLKEAYAKSDAHLIENASAKVRQFSSILIMEDDNAFGIVSRDHKTASTKRVGYLLRKVMTELPKDWEMLYFLVQSSTPPRRATPHLKKLTNSTLTSCYAINYRIYNSLIEHLKKIENPLVRDLLPVDCEIAKIQARHKCYATFPALAYQREGKSQIVGWTADFLRQMQP